MLPDGAAQGTAPCTARAGLPQLQLCETHELMIDTMRHRIKKLRLGKTAGVPFEHRRRCLAPASEPAQPKRRRAPMAAAYLYYVNRHCGNFCCTCTDATECIQLPPLVCL